MASIIHCISAEDKKQVLDSSTSSGVKQVKIGRDMQIVQTEYKTVETCTHSSYLLTCTSSSYLLTCTYSSYLLLMIVGFAAGITTSLLFTEVRSVKLIPRDFLSYTALGFELPGSRWRGQSRN